MNIYDVIIWYIIFSILFSIMVLWAWSNYKDITNLKIDSQVISFQDKVTNYLNYMNNQDSWKLWHIDFVKNKKINFMDSFGGVWFNIPSSSKDNSDYSCYNFFLDDNKIVINKKITDLDIDIFDNTLKRTNYKWLIWDENLLNIICLYNTNDYLWLNSWINESTSPIAYILYSFYEDIWYNKKYFTRKWILYFN